MTDRTTSGFLAAIVASLAIGCSQDLTPSVTAAIQEVVTAAPVDEGGRAGAEAAAFYAARAHAPMWVTRGRSASAADALAVIRSAPDHGLTAADYVDETVVQQIDTGKAIETQLRDDPRALARFDVQLTTALLALGRDVAVGRGDPAGITASWKKHRKTPDLAATLADAAGDGGSLQTWLDRVRPRHPEYAALQKVLAGINAQQRAGGAPDARAGRIALNLERWRWMPDDLGARHIIVNVPAYYMAARENGMPALEMKVIVGKPEHATPIFSDEIETVVFSPYWNVPDSIAEGETAPAAARDPGFLRRQNIEILRRTAAGTERVNPESVNWDDAESLKTLAFRQKPGANNALGHVKFLFPNQYDVYLHDTPADRLFFREGRALSHGCVRLERPEELAQYLLRDRPEWTDERIDKAMHAGEESHVALAPHLPVHLVYFTVWPRGDGDVDLFDDAYGYDDRQLASQRRGRDARLSRK